MQTQSIDPVTAARQDRDLLVQAIENCGSTVRGHTCQCPNPGHDDSHPSASIFQARSENDEPGPWRVRCFSCNFLGDVFDVRSANEGVPVGDLLVEARGGQARQYRSALPVAPQPFHAPSGVEVAQFDYDFLARLQFAAANTTSARKSLAIDLGVSERSLERLRVGWRPDINGETDNDAWTFPIRDANLRIIGIQTRYRNGLKKCECGSQLGIFVPAMLKRQGPLLICEGASDLAAALDMGFEAVARVNNNHEASENLLVTFIARHPDRREIWLIPDQDAPGSIAANGTAAGVGRLAEKLHQLDHSRVIKIIKLPDGFKDLRKWATTAAPAPADIIDDMIFSSSKGPSRAEELRAIADSTIRFGPAAALAARYAAIRSGEFKAVPMPWPALSFATSALLPGCVTLIYGRPGSTKSFAVMNLMAHLHDQGVKGASFFLEDDIELYAGRGLAQRTGCGWLTTVHKHAGKAESAEAMVREHEEWLHSFGSTITLNNTGSVSFRQVLDWIKLKADAGCRVIAVDAVSLINPTPTPWIDASNFMATVKPIIEQRGISLVLVNHLKTGAKGLNLSDMAGGADWGKRAHCVLGIDSPREPVEVSVRVPGGERLVVANRIVHIEKTRVDGGQFSKVAMSFEPDSLRFTEHGMIVKKTARGQNRNVVAVPIPDGPVPT